MKKILAGVIIGMVLFSLPVFAAKVNMGLTGTAWIWRIESGTDIDLLNTEAGGYVATEAGARIMVEQIGTTSPVFKSLIGQGWAVTDSDANIPQGLQGTDAVKAYDFALIETGAQLILEDTKNIRLEN